MAEFLPFHGLRYNCDKVDLCAVLAPPYDVIKGDMRGDLVARSDYNVVGVELPAGEGDAKYEGAARLLEAWTAKSILVRDDPEFYVYAQEFQVPGSGEVRQRRGVLGVLRLEEFGEGVQPHEFTLSGPKEDRLKLLRATRTNTSPIFGLFADNDGWVTSLIANAYTEHPLCEARDAEGVLHRLWHMSDDETVNAMVAALEDEPILIADGHHRYETALNYRNERRDAALAAGHDWTGDEPENFVLMMIVSTLDEGLIVLPTHRLVKNVAADKIDSLIHNLEQYFEVGVLPQSGEGALPDSSETPCCGLHLKGQSYSLRLRPGQEHLAALDAERRTAYNALDVTILHTLILEKQLGIGAAELAAGGSVGYTIDAAEAVRKVDAGEYQAAFLLRPTPIEQVQQVAAAGDRMPQKSTYFYPKLVTGMVLRPLD
jgi:uncharacterized protein (DUF1015 family)